MRVNPTAYAWRCASIRTCMHIHKCVLSREGGTKRERGECGERERERESVRMHGARSGPSGVFKARSVAPSRGMRQSIITVLHIDTTVGHTGPRGAEPRASSQRQRQRGERAREEGAHTLDRVQGCPPLSAAPRYPPWPHTRTRGPTNDIGSSIILVPRISSARYCHRERLMFRPGPSPSSPLDALLRSFTPSRCCYIPFARPSRYAYSPRVLVNEIVRDRFRYDRHLRAQPARSRLIDVPLYPPLPLFSLSLSLGQRKKSKHRPVFPRTDKPTLPLPR